MRNGRTFLTAAVVFACAGMVDAQQTMPASSKTSEAKAVYKLKITSDVTADVTSVDALLAQIVKPGTTDAQKCAAAWQAIYRGRFWNPDSRCVMPTMGGTDPILILNCFAPTICQQDAEMCVALWQQLGFSGRVYQLMWHTTSEAFYDGQWRHLDATSGSNTKDDDGRIISVTERKPGSNGKTWIRPNSFVSHTDGYVIGHRMELDLRSGESFTRYWGPLGKDADYWIPGADGKRPADRLKGDPNLPMGQTSMLGRTFKLAERRFEPMPTDAAYANGLWLFAPDFASPQWSELLYDRRNLAAGIIDGTACLHPAQAGQDSMAIFRIRSPYILTGGWLTATVTAGQMDSAAIAVSVDGGRTWKDMWAGKSAGVENVKIALHDAINSRFDYLIRVTMKADKDVAAVRLSEVKIESIVQINPFSLPALKLGTSTISVSAGDQLETMTILPNLENGDYRKLIVAEENVQTAREGKHEGWVQGICAREGGKDGWLIFKVVTPGDMKRVRWGGRLLGDNENNKFYYSFDNKNWQEQKWTYRQTTRESQNQRRGEIADYETLDNIPAGTKEVYLKLWFTREASPKNKSRLHIGPSLRIDADYKPATEGKISPLAITYCWNEFDGDKTVEKSYRQIVDKLPMDYTITVGGSKEPIMKSVKVEYAQDGK